MAEHESCAVLIRHSTSPSRLFVESLRISGIDNLLGIPGVSEKLEMLADRQAVLAKQLIGARS